MRERDDFTFDDFDGCDTGEYEVRESGEFEVGEGAQIQVMDAPKSERRPLLTPEDFRRAGESSRRQAARVFSLVPALPEDDEEESGLHMSGDPFDRALGAA